jgi:hypothetical protein
MTCQRTSLAFSRGRVTSTTGISSRMLRDHSAVAVVFRSMRQERLVTRRPVSRRPCVRRGASGQGRVGYGRPASLRSGAATVLWLGGARVSSPGHFGAQRSKRCQRVGPSRPARRKGTKNAWQRAVVGYTCACVSPVVTSGVTTTPNRRATKHFRATAHAVMRRFERGEDWGWCYVDRMLLQPAPRPS